MKRFYSLSLIPGLFLLFSGYTIIKPKKEQNLIIQAYRQSLLNLEGELKHLELLLKAQKNPVKNTNKIRTQVEKARIALKQADLFLRYSDPISHKLINGPLPVEWETEVFEKFEKPYKRIGAGLALITEELESIHPNQDSLLALLGPSFLALKKFKSDSLTQFWAEPDAFYLANRLFILNLASIYTTGFDCPDRNRILPELKAMATFIEGLYQKFNQSFPNQNFSQEYLLEFGKLVRFLDSTQNEADQFDHFSFLKNHVVPLFSLNQKLILKYNVQSKNLLDYSLNDQAGSLFSKNLFYGLDPNGIYNRLEDPSLQNLADSLGKMLFFDPILSGNDERSCASCHNPETFFTDTSRRFAEKFSHQGNLNRNTPSLCNVLHHHLLMHDGRFYTLQKQVEDVILNPEEMAGKKDEILRKILSCTDYKKGFEALLPHTLTENELSFSHIVSALTRYVGKFSQARSPFDKAMEENAPLPMQAKRGFNLFMGKAQCGTCHFVPQFNGVKPPFTNSEFEVLGTPSQPEATELSTDLGRSGFFDAPETRHAFRTGSVRNSAHTQPYMHNGVYKNLEELIEFYNVGGGVGKGLRVPNQTLPQDSLHLGSLEKSDLIAFIHSLTEDIRTEKKPKTLPHSSEARLNLRKIGGVY